MKMPEAYLKELLQQGKVIPVIGAGVSNAAAGLPGWWRAIEHGLNYARVRNLGETKIAAAFSLLHQNDLTGAAAILKELLNAPSHPFSNWLVDLFYNPPVKSTDLLKSIAYLCAPIVLTTNYDNLLSSTKILGNRAVYTWQDYQQIEQAIYNREEIIVHLHGLATKPDTVILSAGDYAALNDNLGYKAVLQKLWTSYHFLFIGCSSDGATDDDFSSVIHFLNNWFSQTTHRHYILLNQRDIDQEIHVPLLQDGNIEAISFGTNHANLANRINELNPNKEKFLAEEIRTQQNQQQLIRELQELLATGQDNDSLAALLKQMLPGGIYWIDSPQLMAMETALQELNQQLTATRTQLQFYQGLIQGFIELSEVDAAVELWNASNGNPAVLNTEDFVNLAIICHGCLERIPRTLLREIQHRASYAIHNYYYNGYLSSFIVEYKTSRKRAGTKALISYQEDRYFFENLKRIIASLQGFLELDADKLFGEMHPALIASSLPPQFLLLVTREALSIRSRKSPDSELARLEAEANLPFLGAEVCTYNGQRCIVGFTSQKCFYWNPTQALLPTTFFESSLSDSLQGLFLLPTDSGLQLSVFAGGLLRTFTNFVCSAQVKVTQRLDELVYVGSTGAYYGVKLASVAVRDSVVFQVLPSGVAVPLLSTIDLWKLARTSPYLQAAARSLAGPEEVEYDYPFIQGGLLHVMAWEQGEILTYRAKIDFDNHRATLLVLLLMTAEGLEPICTIIIPAKLSLAFDTFCNGQEVNLLLGYLATGAYPKQLLQLVPAVNIPAQLEVGEDNVFFETGTDFMVDHDIISVTWPTAGEAFVVQGSRKLVIVKFPEQECTELAVKGLNKVIVVD